MGRLGLLFTQRLVHVLCQLLFRFPGRSQNANADRQSRSACQSCPRVQAVDRKVSELHHRLECPLSEVFFFLSPFFVSPPPRWHRRTYEQACWIQIKTLSGSERRGSLQCYQCGLSLSCTTYRTIYNARLDVKKRDLYHRRQIP